MATAAGSCSNAGSTLTVTDSTVSDNGSGGIFNDGTSLTVTDSTVSDNSGGLGYGSGIWSGPGGTSAVTSLTVTDSTVSDNSGGGISNDPGSTATVTGSTLSGNSHSAAILERGHADRHRQHPVWQQCRPEQRRGDLERKRRPRPP